MFLLQNQVTCSMTDFTTGFEDSAWSALVVVVTAVAVVALVAVAAVVVMVVVVTVVVGVGIGVGVGVGEWQWQSQLPAPAPEPEPEPEPRSCGRGDDIGYGAAAAAVRAADRGAPPSRLSRLATPDTLSLDDVGKLLRGVRRCQAVVKQKVHKKVTSCQLSEQILMSLRTLKTCTDTLKRELKEK